MKTSVPISLWLIVENAMYRIARVFRYYQCRPPAGDVDTLYSLALHFTVEDACAEGLE